MIYDYITQTYKEVKFTELSDREQNKILKEALYKENKEHYSNIEETRDYEKLGFSQLSDEKKEDILRKYLYEAEKREYEYSSKTRTYEYINNTFRNSLESINKTLKQLTLYYRTPYGIPYDDFKNKSIENPHMDFIQKMKDLIQETFSSYYELYNYITRQEGENGYDEETAKIIIKDKDIDLEIKVRDKLRNIERNINIKIRELDNIARNKEGKEKQ